MQRCLYVVSALYLGCAKLLTGSIQAFNGTGDLLMPVGTSGASGTVVFMCDRNLAHAKLFPFLFSFRDCPVQRLPFPFLIFFFHRLSSPDQPIPSSRHFFFFPLLCLAFFHRRRHSPASFPGDVHTQRDTYVACFESLAKPGRRFAAGSIKMGFGLWSLAYLCSPQ